LTMPEIEVCANEEKGRSKINKINFRMWAVLTG